MVGPQISQVPGTTSDPLGSKNLAFGSFVLQIGAKRLLEGERPVKIGGRAFDLLRLLVEKAGQVVTKDELIAYAWPSTVVEEGNLRVHIAALRKALGDGQQGARYIGSVAGRGYTFLCEVVVLEGGWPTPLLRSPRVPTGVRRNNLPATLVRLLGRGEALARLNELLPSHRLVSIVGPAGIGKTSLGLAAATQALTCFVDGVWFVELANITEPSLIPAAVAEAIDLSLLPENQAVQVSDFLQEKSLLVVLDNCEHVLESVAAFAMQLLKAAPGLHMLLTSREPTKADGERVVRLQTLSLPGEDLVSTEVALSSPAVQLFVERAIANQDGFELTASNTMQVIELCRKLDGLPVAIELAAARVDTFGVSGTLKLIEEHSRLLVGNSRASLPRHRAMSALLDWGYNLLTPFEQKIFKRLSVLRAGFSIEWGIAIGGDGGDDLQVMDGIASLTAKSLLGTQPGHEEVEYRMLQTTRDYAYRRLACDGDERAMRRRHAEFLQSVYSKRDRDKDGYSFAEWQLSHGRAMDDVRFALEWAGGPGGDPELAIRLTLATVSLGVQLGSIEATRQRVVRALELCVQVPGIDSDVVVALEAANADLATQTTGPSDESISSTERVSEMSAEPSSDVQKQMDVFNALWVSSLAAGEYPVTLQWAQKIANLASQSEDADHVALEKRALAGAHSYLGNFVDAIRLCDDVLSTPIKARRIGNYMMAPLDRRVSLGIIKSRTFWIQGRLDEAEEQMQIALSVARVDVAQALGQATCLAAVPLAIWAGKYQLARAVIDEALEHTARYQLRYWRDWLNQYAAIVQWRTNSGDVSFSEQLPVLKTDSAPQRDFFCTLDIGYVDEETVARVDRQTVGWCAAEVHRGRAARLLRRDGMSAFDAALLLLDKAMSSARQQGALFWQLRAGMSLARLWLARGNRGVAAACLAPVYARFSQGLETRDLVTARGLMDVLETATAAFDWIQTLGGPIV